MIANTTRFQQAQAGFDAANAQDPNQEMFEGNSYPKELLYAQRMTTMQQKFAHEATEVVRLAARCQHICRWKSPRNAYPMDAADLLVVLQKALNINNGFKGYFIQRIKLDREASQSPY